MLKRERVRDLDLALGIGPEVDIEPVEVALLDLQMTVAVVKHFLASVPKLDLRRRQLGDRRARWLCHGGFPFLSQSSDVEFVSCPGVRPAPKQDTGFAK